MLQLIPIGGYSEVGKNMTAIRVDDEVVILDMGLHLPNYIELTEDEDIVSFSDEQLMGAGAVPDDTIIEQWANDVKAIIPSHAHLDHIGAIPYMAHRYDCPIICTPFTAEVIKAICKDEKIRLQNKIRKLDMNGVWKISDKITIEFVNMTHSTPQTVMIAVHTPYGIVLYANDFKFDNHPTIGEKPNYKRLEKFGGENVVALVVDSLYADEHIKMPGEKIVREMLQEVIVDTDSRGRAVIVTTFSSHLARLKSIIEFSKKLKRKIVFMGRSLAKYVGAGEDIKMINFSKDVEIVKYGKQIKRRLDKIMKDGPEKYVLVVTGHQGEPKATLSKMANKILPFRFESEDHVVFSCKTIPTPINIEQRAHLEKVLKDYGVKIFKDIHYSGHAGREDLRDLLKMVKPKKIMPAHAERKQMEAMRELAVEMGWKKEDIHLLTNGKMVEF